MNNKPTSESPQPCRHLGLADNPFERGQTPSEDHRCYLWMQRDRIDLDHQNGYCLSGKYRDCPWVQISLPCQPAFKRVWQEAIVCTVSDTGRRMWPRLVILLRALVLVLIATAQSFALWSRENLPKALGYLRTELLPRAGALALKMLRSARHLRLRRGADRARPRVVEKPSIGAPQLVPEDDFEALMRSGRESSRAGQRKQAYSCFSKAVELDPASEDAWLWMAATAEGPDVALSCLERALAINPESGRARTQLTANEEPATPRARKGRGAARAGVNVAKLVEKGIAALDGGNEDDAYQFFTQATETDKANEAAWFWRAKTSTDLAEVIKCLRRVLELNPDNQKAHASLSWAMERQKAGARKTVSLPGRDAQPVIPGLYSQTAHGQPPFLLKLSSTAYMALGLIWIGPAVLPALDAPLAAIYRKIGVLPMLDIPYVSSTTMISDIPLPEFNLMFLIPLSMALMSFVAMEAVWSERRAVSIYLAMVPVASMFMLGVFSTAHAPSMPLTAMSTAVGVAALSGRISYCRRPKSLRVRVAG